MRLLRWVAAAVIATSGAGVVMAQGPMPRTVEARIVDFAFQPAKLKVGVGTTVRWSNAGQIPHVVTDRGGAFDTKPILPKKQSSVTFTVPGTYSYFCRIHPGRMEATIEVAGPSEEARVNRIEASEFTFTPSSLTLATGSLLLLANVGGLPHTLTAEDRTFDTGVVTPGPEGGRFAGTNTSITLTTPGKFPFVCRVHPNTMKGVFTVTGPPRESAAGASSAPAKVNLSMEDFVFRPPEQSVAPGGEITWRNQGATDHTATFDEMSLDTGVVRSGASATLKAPMRPGSYTYRCAIHPTKMRAVLVVVGANMRDPTESRPAGLAATGGSGVGLSSLALSTGVVGAFAGGIGVAAFARRPRRRRKQ